MTTPAEKPQLHWSHLSSLSRCGEQFRLIYVEGMRVPPGVAAVTGTSAHKVAAINLTAKAETGALLSLEEVKDHARDALEETWRGGVELLPAEVEAGLALTRGLAIDRTVRMATAHATELAPTMRPRRGGIERSWVVSRDGFDYDLAGELDLQEDRLLDADGRVIAPSRIRDYKTSGKQPSPMVAATTGQTRIYAIGVEALDGEYPDEVALDYTFDTGKKTVARSFISPLRSVDIDSTWDRLERAAEIIKAGAFTPAQPYVDWVCTPKWCGFARTNPDTGRPFCKFFSEAPVTVAGFGDPKTNRGRNGGSTSGKQRTHGKGSNAHADLLASL